MDNSEKILNVILSECYNTVTEDDILTIHENGKLEMSGRYLTDVEIEILREAADELNKNPLLEIIIKRLQFESTRKMALKSSNWDEIRFPKANLYVVSVIKNVINNLLSFKKKKVVKNDTEKSNE